MSYLVLARKYRPQTFEDVICQEHVTQTLANAISSNRVAHAILFTGPRGTGKTTIARILAKAMNCEAGPTPTPCNQCRSCLEITAGHAADVFEIDGASNNSVDQVRELRDNVKYMPSHGRHKIYIIDEVHMLSVAAFNALLKTLEEPPSHILFFFATTEPHKIPITILSRCQRYDLRRINSEPVFRHLQTLCEAEKIAIPEESLHMVARESGGSMRDALSLLDQVMACCQGEIRHEEVLDVLGAFDGNSLCAISEAVTAGDVPAILTLLEEFYISGRDLKKLYNDLLLHFRNLLVIKMAGKAQGLVDLSPQDVDRIRTQVAGLPVSHLDQMLDMFAREEGAVRFSPQPKLAMELALIRLSQLKPVLSIDTLIERLDVLRQEIAAGGRVVMSVPALSAPAPPASMPQVPMSPAARSETPAPPVAAPVPQSLPRTVSPSSQPGELWTAVLAEIGKQQLSLAPCFAGSSLLNVAGNRFEVEVSGNSFNLSRIRQPKGMDVLRAACTAVMGRPMEVSIVEKVVVTESIMEAKKKENQLKAEAASHPLVNDVMELLGGKVVDVKIKQEERN